MIKLKFTRLADTDLDEIWNYIADENHEAADRLMAGLLEKCGLISQNAEIGRARHELSSNLRSFPFKNYVIYYVPIENGVEIQRVLHSARDLEEIFS